MEITKTCSKCGELKAVEFYYAKHLKCKACYGKHAYAISNKAVTREYQKKWCELNRQKLRESQQRYKIANPEKWLASKAKWTLCNKEQKRKSEKVRVENSPDAYIRNLIKCSTGIPVHLIPPELIEVQRKHLQLTRKIKEMKNA